LAEQNLQLGDSAAAGEFDFGDLSVSDIQHLDLSAEMDSPWDFQLSSRAPVWQVGSNFDLHAINMMITEPTASPSYVESGPYWKPIATGFRKPQPTGRDYTSTMVHISRD
jgi:hypothetical protein